jgi:hypothetical protein
VRPRGYLEVGVNDGRSLTLSRVPTIAIDPEFCITSEVSCDVRLVKATSDDFFARPGCVDHLPGGVIDFGFIDGMHLSEFAYRDFMNVERLSTWTSVIVFDDMLPRSAPEAARDRYTKFWAGDVYKASLALQRLRPDLVCIPVDTTPTGMLLVLGANATDTTLRSAYDGLLAEFTAPDPQAVPTEVLQRTSSADPEKVVASPVWADLVAAREAGAPRDPAVYEPMRSLRGTGPVVPVVAPEPVRLRDHKPPARVPARPPASRKRASPRAEAVGRRSALRRRTRKLLRRIADRL